MSCENFFAILLNPFSRRCNTIIARHIRANVVEINVKKYSVTTTKIQNKLKQLAKEYGYDVVEVIGE